MSTGGNTNFQKEISKMMHGFGDNPNPNAATVVMIEQIVLQQLQTMLEEASNYSQIRGAGCKNITNYEIIFLLRKNKIKMKRLHDYQLKLNNVEKRYAVNVSEDGKVKKKRQRTHIAIIKDLDETIELSDKDVEVIDCFRKFRANKISEMLTSENYLAYHKARCSSFRTSPVYNKGYTKLEHWVNPVNEFKISLPALEVLSFLAYETVAEIVDGVFLIRQDAKKKRGDPFGKYEGGNFCNPVSLHNVVYANSGYEGVQPITVAEVREVMRRYSNPISGMNGLFYRNMSQGLPNKYIAF